MCGVVEGADVVAIVSDVVEMGVVVVEEVGVSGVAVCVLRVVFLCEIVVDVLLGVMKYKSVGSAVLEGSSVARNFWRPSCSLTWASCEKMCSAASPRNSCQAVRP